MTKTKQANPKVRMIAAVIAFAALLPLAGYANTHTIVKATVTSVVGDTVAFETLNGNIYTIYVNNTELCKGDKVKLLMANNDQSTFTDDEIVKVF